MQPLPDAACDHAGGRGVIEECGQRVCMRCGLVLELRLMQDEWRPEPSIVSSREWVWRRAVKAFLSDLGVVEMQASAFAPPAHANGVPYRVLVAYAYWLRFARDLPSNFARTASRATAAEWRRAARAYDHATDAEPEDEVEMLLEALCRRHGLARQLAGAAARAMQEPRLETCEPLHVLVACVAESLGDALTARIFRMQAEAVQRYRARHRVAAFAVDLEAAGLALQAHVERCEQYEPAEHTLQTHLRSCASCCCRAEELELSFLLSCDVDG